jgi:hypothetical protein
MHLASAHGQLCELMRESLGTTSAGGPAVLRHRADVVAVAEGIQWRSASVAAAAAEMREAVRALVEELERNREQFDRPARRGFFGWLQAVCGALAAALDAAAHGVATFVPVVSGVLHAGSALARAAQDICQKHKGAYLHTYARTRLAGERHCRVARRD